MGGTDPFKDTLETAFYQWRASKDAETAVAYCSESIQAISKQTPSRKLAAIAAEYHPILAIAADRSAMRRLTSS